MIFVYIFIILAGCFILIKSADLVIRALTYLAGYLHLSEFVVSFILLGMITSLPELFVGILSALHKTPTLSLGNVFGANIIDITLGIGLAAILIKRIKTETAAVQKNLPYIILIFIYPILLLSDGILSRLDALALLVAFILYNIILFHQSERYEKTMDRVFRRYLLKNLVYLFIGIGLLVGGAEIMVRASMALSFALDIPVLFIGLFLVSIGTALPEISLAIRAALKRHEEIILGTMLGTLVFNITAILGTVALISPIEISNLHVFLTSSIFMLVSILCLWFFSRSNKKISWQEGVILIVIYILFVAIEFWLKRG